MRFASWLGLTLAAVAVQAGYRVPQDLGPKLDEVFKPWDKKDAPGGAVFVSVHGKIVYEKAFGMANLELDVPNTTSTVFDVGSVSKQFTATCVMLLAEQGKFSIDDEASKYLPEYPVLSDNKITIRQLLDHTSGVRDILSLMVFKTKGIAFSNEDADKTLRAQRSLNFKPGTNWSYSNSNYYLLMKLVEKESGKSLAEFAKEAIFDPLGMNHTLFLDDPAKLIHDRAFGYVPTPKGYRAGLSMIAIDGPGGLWTTLD
ncbi:MAG TPA: serine hydrolase domain-containing protein, partial [Fimbriimonadaceae bacterium]|nr:serine hydrolase domain-containing protein [Fimbriimonadaceae bacterium]